MRQVNNMPDINDFNQIKNVINALDNERPARLGYTQAAIDATGAAEVDALTGVFIDEDSSQINSIPTPALIATDPLVQAIGLRTQAATVSRMMINHYFGRLGLNLLKLTEKVKFLVSHHLVNRYITPSGKVVESITVSPQATVVNLLQNQSPLAANAPATEQTIVAIPAAVSAGNAGVLTGADKKRLDDLHAEAARLTDIPQTFLGATTFSKKITGSISGNADGKAETAGRADTADKLFVARNIGGVPFDGTADIELNIPQINSAGILRKAAKPNLMYKRPMGNMITEKWYAQASAADNHWWSVCWSPELGIFCAVAETGTGNRVMTSPNGINWTIQTSAADNGWNSVCWSPELGLFCAVANAGTNRVMTSPNGINWTIRTSAADNPWMSVCWSPELGLFCAVANWSATLNQRVMTSPNGINWTIRSTAGANNSWYSVCWSPELGIFCAVANSGTGNRVMTSPNGIDWTIRTSAADNGWRSVCWSPELGLFCAVATSGASDGVMTSPNGIDWTTRTSAADNNWNSVCWSPELGLFCAVASSGTGNRVMTSPNGINWTIRTNPAANTWYSVCWSPELGLFCAVAGAGAGNRVMTSRNMKMILG
jgi:hypothetical protein